MKKIFAVLTLMIIATITAQADFYIKEEVRIDSLSDGITVDSKVVEINETWIGKNKVKIVEKSKIIIVDLNKNIFTFMNPRDKIYVETMLPIDLTKFFTFSVLKGR